MFVALLVAPAARAQDAVFPTVETREVLNTAYAAILERHLESVAPRDLALWSLRGLGAVDPTLGAEIRGGMLRLTGTPPPPPSRGLPGTTGPPAAPATAEAVAALMEAAWRASPALRRLSPERMLQAAFDEVFDRLDPYSRYVSVSEGRAARERRTGQSGLGLRLGAGARGGAVVVVALSPGGPAALGGLRLGERVLAVDGTAVNALDLPAAAALLEGPSNAPVALTVLRGGRRREVVLLRNAAPPPTVQAERRDDILWLRISGFSNTTDGLILGSLEEAFRTDPPLGVVLDLRGNRGGVLTQAIGVVDIFLAGGEIIRTTGRHRESGRTYVAGGPDITGGRPVVVLVDGRSASAAEIVAASLSDRGRAVLVGSATQGKGLVQLLVPLPNGAEILLSWSRLVAPLGWPLQDVGVLPHICTSLGAEQAGAALVRLQRGEAPARPALERMRAMRVPPNPDAVAELRATCPPAEGRDADLAVARALIENPEAWRLSLAR